VRVLEIASEQYQVFPLLHCTSWSGVYEKSQHLNDKSHDVEEPFIRTTTEVWGNKTRTLRNTWLKGPTWSRDWKIQLGLVVKSSDKGLMVERSYTGLVAEGSYSVPWLKGPTRSRGWKVLHCMNSYRRRYQTSYASHSRTMTWTTSVVFLNYICRQTTRTSPDWIRYDC